MCAMLRMKTLEISWVFMNCTRMKSSLKPSFLLPNQVVPGVDSKVLLDFSVFFF